MKLQSLIDNNINKNNIKPVLIMVSSLLCFPLGYCLCFAYYKLNLIITMLMTLSLVVIGWVLFSNKVHIYDVLWFLNILSFSFISVYLIPVLNKNRNFKKSTLLFRFFVMMIYLIPVSFMPLYFLYGDHSKGFEIERGFIVYFSFFEMAVIIVSSVIWYLCAVLGLLWLNRCKRPAYHT